MSLLISLFIATVVVMVLVYCIRLLVSEQPWRNILIVLVILIALLMVFGGYVPRFPIY